MSERSKYLKKAVLSTVGASSNVERVKDALKEAMQDLVKVGQELIDDLEEKGKIKTESAQSFLKGLSDEAAKRTGGIDKKLSTKLQKKVRDTAREFGFVSAEMYDEVVTRLKNLEDHLGIVHEKAEEEAVDVEAEVEGESENGKKKKGKNKEA